MERHIGLWREDDEETPAIAELIIDGNHIEFYHRDADGVFPHAYISNDNEHSYKVFTNGTAEYGKYQTLNNVTSCKAFFVLQQNDAYKSGLSIDEIMEASFFIPELIDWLRLKTVELAVTEQSELIAVENKLPNILLSSKNPKVEIYFESNHSFFSPYCDRKTTVSISNKPRIKISYAQAVDVYALQNDIRAIMRFFALMIGHITDALDIRLNIQGQTSKSWLYVNEDFSYNLKTISTLDILRTEWGIIQNNIQSYFENWYEFYCNNKFELITRMYFDGNKKKDIYTQDIFVQYVRILEGYHLRTTDEEHIVSTLNKDIKKIIFTDEGKSLFEPIFAKANWIFNSKHANDVSTWISTGFLLRTTLAQRLKQLDNQYFNIILKNSDNISKVGGTCEKSEFDYYQQIADTRNYFSHYKVNDDSILNFSQICDTVNVLKALIIMIFYTHMGMSKDDARKTIMWDDELRFQTKCLRTQDEQVT